MLLVAILPPWDTGLRTKPSQRRTELRETLRDGARACPISVLPVMWMKIFPVCLGPFALGFYVECKKSPKNWLFKRFYLVSFRERRREGEREGEKYQCVVASCMPPVGDLACNPGVCPPWESNQWSFGLLAHAQSTELHQPGTKNWFLMESFNIFRMSRFNYWELC